MPRFTRESNSSPLSMYSIAFIDVINTYDTWMIHELRHNNFAVDIKALLIRLCLPSNVREPKTKSRGRILMPVDFAFSGWSKAPWLVAAFSFCRRVP